MIKSSFNRFLVLLVGLLTMCVTQMWGADVMVTFKATDLSGTNNSYALKTGSASGINYSSYSYTNKGNYQFNGGKGTNIFFNTSALPAAIKSIKATKASGSDRSVTAYVSKFPITSSNYSSATSLGAKDVTTNGTTWTLTAAQIAERYTYFYLHYSTSNALYVSQFDVTYTEDAGGDPDPGTGGSGEWTKVTSLSEITTGYKYLIVSNGAKTYMMSSSVVSNRFSNGAEATISGNTVTNATIAENCQWEIFKSGDYYYIKQDSKYAGGTTTKNQGAMIATQTDLTKWTVTVDGGVFDFVNYGRSQQSTYNANKYLRSNTTNGWACYATETGANCMLFRQATGPATYTASVISPAPVNGSIKKR